MLAISDAVFERISISREKARRPGGIFLLDMAHDVFEHHDGVVGRSRRTAEAAMAWFCIVGHRGEDRLRCGARGRDVHANPLEP